MEELKIVGLAENSVDMVTNKDKFNENRICRKTEEEEEEKAALLLSNPLHYLQNGPNTFFESNVSKFFSWFGGGKKYIHLTAGDGIFLCPICGNYQEYKYKLLLIKRYIFIFIPIGCEEQVGSYIKCTACCNHFDEAVLDKIQKQQKQQQQQFHCNDNKTNNAVVTAEEDVAGTSTTSAPIQTHINNDDMDVLLSIEKENDVSASTVYKTRNEDDENNNAIGDIHKTDTAARMGGKNKTDNHNTYPFLATPQHMSSPRSVVTQDYIIISNNEIRRSAGSSRMMRTTNMGSLSVIPEQRQHHKERVASNNNSCCCDDFIDSSNSDPEGELIFSPSIIANS